MTSRFKRIIKSKWSWLSTLIAATISIYIVLQIHAAITNLEYTLTPPDLPTYHKTTDKPKLLNAEGYQSDSAWFHYASQGTATLPIPYSWIVALEAPKSSPWYIFFGSEKLFKDDYLLRLGFIKQDVSQYNPDGFPIGFAKTPSIYFPGINRKAEAIGFTCAACHTGQLIYNDKRYIIDGGPAVTDLGQLTKSLGTALGQTALSSRFSIFNGRFERFAKRVLGSNYNVLTRKKLKQELNETIQLLVSNSDTINVTEGYGRLDALNRIGNQVFDADMHRSANYAPIDAPVSFPHIWTTSWFDWVQYDGSIMQPLVRNAGEALGVQAYVDTTGPAQQRFASSVNYTNLVKIEQWLAGTHPRSQKSFNGLQAPKWPDTFPKVNTKLAEQGKSLYQSLCMGCHKPAINTTEFWADKHWKKISYIENNETKQTRETFLKLAIIPIEKIGTDPAQANVLPQRTVDTTGLNLNTEVCTPLEDESGLIALRFKQLTDSATANYGLALGAFVQRTNAQWFAQSFTPKSKVAMMEGQRPNCLQVAQGYKARPLDGVWATAPFLHNGSIATIYDLLSTQNERPMLVELGTQTFDPRHLGLQQSEHITKLIDKYKDQPHQLTPDYVDGLFLLDVRQSGNHNSGHLFDDKNTASAGRIGPKLNHEQKMALIEYLKTL